MPPEVVSAFGFQKDDSGNTWWLISNSRYEIVNVGFKPPNEEYGAWPVLILEERIRQTHIGIPGGKSKISLTAWLLDERSIRKKLWRIESEGDVWAIKDDEILFTKYGCCDQKDHYYKYNLLNGSIK